MAARIWPVDAVTGAPSYSGRMLRQSAVSPLVAGATTARPLGGQSGVRPGTASNIATATSTVWTVTPFAGLLDGATAAEAGVYGYSFDSNQTGAVTAAGASARTDRLDVQLVDPAEGGVAGANPLIRIVYTVGTPTLAAAPAQSHPLARINVPISGGGSPTVTWVATYAVAAGGILPTLSVSAYPASPSTGQQVDDATIGHPNRYNGSAWANPALATMFADRGTAPANVIVNASATWQDVTSVTVTGNSAGGVCEVVWDATSLNVTATASGYIDALYQVLCDGVAVGGTRVVSIQGVSGGNPKSFVGGTVRHTPTAGSHTWKLQAQAVTLNTIATSFASIRVSTS